MKVSVSLPDGDVAFVDEYAESHRENSRSAVIRKAIRLLRETQLVEAYRAAYAEWHESREDTAWEAVVGDGMAREPDEAR
jgi:Arc/MetJ-type ribon-helix-helix transcriptional regulator